MSTVMVPPGRPNPMDPSNHYPGLKFPPFKLPNEKQDFPTLSPEDMMIVCFPTDLPINKKADSPIFKNTDGGWRRPVENQATDCWEIPGRPKLNQINVQASRFPTGSLQVTNRDMRAQVESFDFNSNKKLAMGDRMMESALRARQS